MSTVPSIAQTGPGSGPAPAPSSTGGAAGAQSALSSDFETFLTLMTTQLENQDPLDPLDSADFAVQLATFSGVEQQVRTNELLERLTGSLGGSDIGALASLVGMEALVEAPVAFDGTPIELGVEVPAGAEAAAIVAYDAAGVAVSRDPVLPGQARAVWAGASADGGPLGAGPYRFELEILSGGTVAETRPVGAYAPIGEVRVEDGAALVVLSGGAIVAREDIAGLRNPERT